MATFYKGTEVKFSISLTAQGFSMDDDEFEIEVVTPRASVKGYKTPTESTQTTDIVIFKEVPSTDEDSSDEAVSSWYGIVDTSKLNVGEVRVVATAHIPDSNAPDGIRDEIAVAKLGTLTNA